MSAYINSINELKLSVVTTRRRQQRHRYNVLVQASIWMHITKTCDIDRRVSYCLLSLYLLLRLSFVGLWFISHHVTATHLCKSRNGNILRSIETYVCVMCIYANVVRGYERKSFCWRIENTFIFIHIRKCVSVYVSCYLSLSAQRSRGSTIYWSKARAQARLRLHCNIWMKLSDALRWFGASLSYVMLYN